MFAKPFLLPLLTAFSLSFLPGTSHAATSTRSASIEVSVRVVGSCTVSTGANVMRDSDVSMKCAQPVSYAVAVESGSLTTAEGVDQGLVHTREGMTATITY